MNDLADEAMLNCAPTRSEEVAILVQHGIYTPAGMDGMAGTGSLQDFALSLVVMMPTATLLASKRGPNAPLIIDQTNSAFANLLAYDGDVRGHPLESYLGLPAAGGQSWISIGEAFGRGNTQESFILHGGSRRPIPVQASIVPITLSDDGRNDLWLVMLQESVAWGLPRTSFGDIDTFSRLALESSSDWTWATDDQHRFIYISEDFREMTGLTPDYAVGRTRWDVMAKGADIQAMRRHKAEMDAHQSFRDFTYPTHTGGQGLRFFRDSGRPIYGADGSFRGFCGTGRDVTRDEQTKIAAALFERRLRAVIENMEVGFSLFLPERALVVANSAFRRFFPGMEQRLSIGQKFRADVRDGDRKPGTGAGEDFAYLVERAMRGEIETPTIDRYQTKDGKWLKCSWVRLEDGTLAVMLTDLAERLVGDGVPSAWDVTVAAPPEIVADEDDEASMGLEATLLDGIENMAGAFVLWDADDRLVMFNSQAQGLYGEEEDIMVIGRDFEEIIRLSVERGHIKAPTENRDAWIAERVRHHRETSEVMTRRYPDGRWIRITEHPTHEGGIVGVGVDITELKKREFALDKAREEAESANAAKSAFLAAASHDLRQPLHAMGLFADSLVKRLDGKPEVDLAENLRRSLSSMKELFDALLDISRLDAAVLEPVERVFPVNAVLDKMTDTFAMPAFDKGLRFTALPSSLHTRTDPAMLERIVGNFVANAVRYTRSGGILVGVRRHGDKMRISVLDTGPGIPKGQLRNIFKEFHQLGNPERDQKQGLGLGLAIAERLARLLKLKIGVDSHPERGSCFFVEVPIVAAERPAAASPSRAAPPVRSTRPAFDGVRVGIIDDNEEILAAMDAALADLGCQGYAGTSPEELLMSDGQFDLLIADFRLRDGLTGTEAIKRVREALGRDIPGIIVTGDTAPERLREARASGFQLLHKPVKTANLAAVMRHLLAKG